MIMVSRCSWRLCAGYGFHLPSPSSLTQAYRLHPRLLSSLPPFSTTTSERKKPAAPPSRPSKKKPVVDLYPTSSLSSATSSSHSRNTNRRTYSSFTTPSVPSPTPPPPTSTTLSEQRWSRSSFPLSITDGRTWTTPTPTLFLSSSASHPSSSPADPPSDLSLSRSQIDAYESLAPG